MTHGYLTSQLEKDEYIDKSTNNWLQLRFSAHVEGYLMAVQEQELDTKATWKRREKDEEKSEKWTLDVEHAMRTRSRCST